MHPNSPRLLDCPKGWVEVLYFRNKTVLGSPVSTTSYSQYAVSTIQTRSTGPDNRRSLTDTDGARQFLHGLQFLSFPSYSNIPYNQIIETSYISRVTGNYSTSTDSYFQHGMATDLHILVFRPTEPRDHATRVSFNAWKLNA